MALDLDHPNAGSKALVDAAELDRAGRHEEAISCLRNGVAAGDMAAATPLGQRLLVGKNAPFEPKEGAQMVRKAADGGDPAALLQMATLAGAGAWTEQSWPAAFDFLQRAAEAGSSRAQGQLEVIANDPSQGGPLDASGGADRWARLRARIDVDRWVAPADRRPVCESPRVRVSEGFMAPAVCDWLVGCSTGKLKPARMFDGASANPLETRTCSDFIFDIVDGDLVILLLRLRISNLVKLPTVVMEPPQIFHYAVGQEIKAHYDLVRGEGSSSQSERIVTVLGYLNDDYEGGELLFPKVGFSFKGKKGDALFFANVDPSGAPDRLSLHAAKPVSRGEKFMLSQWIQDRPTADAA